MGCDYICAASRFSVDALALVLFSQSQRGDLRVEHKRSFDGNGRGRYDPVREYCGPRTKYHVRQPGGRKGLK